MCKSFNQASATEFVNLLGGLRPIYLARFKDSDVRLTLSNAAGKQIAMSIDTGETGNVCYLACLDNNLVTTLRVVMQ